MLKSLTLHGRQVKENYNCFSDEILSETKTAGNQYVHETDRGDKQASSPLDVACESSGKNIICSIEVKSPQQDNLPVRKKRIRANGMLTWDKTKRHASLTTSLISIAENLHFALEAKKRRFHEEGFRDTRVGLVPKIWGWVTESIITTFLIFF